MKKVMVLLLSGIPLLLSCNKAQNCGEEISACRDYPPTGELCTASFSRWFYQQSSNSCELIGYSGCTLRGFATQEECEQCACD